jgi:hypothetical protein
LRTGSTRASSRTSEGIAYRSAVRGLRLPGSVPCSSATQRA